MAKHIREMAKRIKVGVITHAGGAHLGAYFPALTQAEEVGTVVLSDPSGSHTAAARKTLGGKFTEAYLDPITMLAREKPAMVLVTMEAALAPPAIDAALEAGSHVFAEKPACIRVVDFAKLVRKAHSKHLYLMLALANRLNPPIVEARRLLQSGKIGKVYGLEMHMIADQTRLTRPSYHQSWFANKARAGGGHLIWLGIHWLDLAMLITGAKIEQVAGFAGNIGGQPVDIEDSAAISMRFDNGTFGTLTSGYYLDRGYHSHIKIWGSHGWLHLHQREEVPLSWYSTREQDPQVHQYNGPTETRGYTPFVRAAVRACAGLGEPPITADESLHALRTVFAAYKAAETGQRQDVG